MPERSPGVVKQNITRLAAVHKRQIRLACQGKLPAWVFTTRFRDYRLILPSVHPSPTRYPLHLFETFVLPISVFNCV